MQVSLVLFWVPSKVCYFSSPAYPPGRCSLDNSAATGGEQWRCWCLGSATQGNAAKGEPCTGSPRRRSGGREVYHNYPNLQPHRPLAQATEPLPGSASSSADCYSLEQHWGADASQIMGLIGSSSSPGCFQRTDYQSNAQQTTAIPWDSYGWLVYLWPLTVSWLFQKV